MERRWDELKKAPRDEAVSRCVCVSVYCVRLCLRLCLRVSQSYPAASGETLDRCLNDR